MHQLFSLKFWMILGSILAIFAGSQNIKLNYCVGRTSRKFSIHACSGLRDNRVEQPVSVDAVG